MARRPPPSLSEVSRVVLDKDSDDLRWYFQEAHALQGGLRSSQSNLERSLELSGSQMTRDRHHFDFRRFKHVRRARRIEERLNAIPRLQRDVLRLCYQRRQVPPLGILTGLAVELFPEEPIIDYAMALAADPERKKIRKRMEKILLACQEEYAGALKAYRNA